MYKWEPLFSKDTGGISVRPETVTFDSEGNHAALYAVTTSLNNDITLNMNITSDMPPDEVRNTLARAFGKWPTPGEKNEEEAKYMEPTREKRFGNGFYANPTITSGKHYLRRVNGDHLYLKLDEWDGNVKSIQDAITREYGWIDRMEFFTLKDKLACAFRVKKSIEKKLRVVPRRGKMFKLPSGIWIERVIYNGPATIIFWSDKTKTVVKCGENDEVDHEKGLAMAISKKVLGNQGNYFNEFKLWLEEKDE